MKAIVLEKHSMKGYHGLKYKDVQSPEPGNDQVKIKIKAIGINFADIISRRGLYSWAPKLPYIPGMEVSGEVIAIGNNVKGVAKGDYVIAGMKQGAYAEEVVLHQRQVSPALPYLTDIENGAFLVNWMTAYLGLVTMARIHYQESVLIHSAAGGVGTAAVLLMKAMGISSIYGTFSSVDKKDFLTKLGVDEAIHLGSQDFEAIIKEKTKGRGVDVILDSYGGEIFRKSTKVIAPMGRLLSIGISSINTIQKWNPFSWLNAYRKLPRVNSGVAMRRSFGTFYYHLGFLLEHDATIPAHFQDLREFAIKHQLKPVIAKTFPLKDVIEAHKYIEERKNIGKILLIP